MQAEHFEGQRASRRDQQPDEAQRADAIAAAAVVRLAVLGVTALLKSLWRMRGARNSRANAPPAH
jgi:hypothetical protein